MLPLLVALFAAVTLPAKPDQYVTDRAGVLSAERTRALNEKLAAFERQTSDQILVYVDHRIPEGTTLEEYANALFSGWAVGQKGKDNGAVLFLFIDDRKMRIEVGYGLEGALTDARCFRIINEVLRPRLRAGDYDAAVASGVEAMLDGVRGEPYRGDGLTVADRLRYGWREWWRERFGGFSQSDWIVFIVLGTFVIFGPIIWVGLLLAGAASAAKTFTSRGPRTAARWSGSGGDSSWSSSSSGVWQLVVFIFLELQRRRRKQRRRRRQRVVVITRGAAPRSDRGARRATPG